MKIRSLIALAGVALSATIASASPVIYGAATTGTNSLLHGGDRELTSLAFTGTASTFSGADFLRFTDGSLNNNVGGFAWGANVLRDVDSSNNYTGNPDRADNSTPYLGELSTTGTLSEVFGSFGGYKNMSRLIDGEDTGAWTLDLFFAPGQTLSADADSSTTELAFLERGRNSDMNIYGIRADRSTTGPVFLSRSNFSSVGWTLDTLEIDGAQDVGGVGVSLDSSWTNLIGVRVEATADFNGPDLIAVGSARTTPTPGATALLAIAGLVLRSSRRR